jgi:hypothetical protein
MEELALLASGIFAFGLGIVHLAIPRIFDFAGDVGQDGRASLPHLSTLTVGPWRYRRRRADVLGLSWVMSNAASYVLISIGLLDLLAGRWATEPAGRVLFAWIAGWWGIRAGGQFIVGRRSVDWLFAGLFAVLGIVSLAAAFGAA